MSALPELPQRNRAVPLEAARLAGQFLPFLADVPRFHPASAARNRPCHSRFGYWKQVYHLPPLEADGGVDGIAQGRFTCGRIARQIPGQAKWRFDRNTL